MKNNKTIYAEWETQDFFFDLEKIWRDSLPHLSDIQWLEVFPEARGVLADKANEWGAEKKRLISIAKRALRENSRRTADEYLATRLYAQIRIMPRINAAEGHLARLRRQQAHFAPSLAATDRITDADIQRARDVPITLLVPSNTRNTGKTLTMNCPLHKDRTPSFVVYRESNSCWCFGCQQGGDSIALTRLLHSLSFIDAVKYLQNV